MTSDSPRDVSAVARRQRKSAGEDEQAEHGNSAVTISGTFWQSETKCRAKDDSEEAKPADSKTNAVGEREERLADERMPYGADWFGDDRVGDIPEGNEGDEGPREEGLDNPRVG